MTALFALLLQPALAADMTQELTWQVTLDGKPVGKKDLTVKWTTNSAGELRRMLESWTEVDASVIGITYSFRQRLTGSAAGDAASFASVSQLGGDVVEVQARQGGGVWMVSINQNGTAYDDDHPREAVNLSLVDLMDPESRVPLSDYTYAKILSPETGLILEGPVKTLGAGQVDVAGTQVPVTGWSWTPDQGEGRFWYSNEGYLVRYEVKVMGRNLTGTLTKPPPKGTDDEPLIGTGSGITEVPL